MRKVRDKSYVDPLSVKTDMECEFGWGSGEPDVIKKVLNHAHESTSLETDSLSPEYRTWSPLSSKVCLHLAKDVWMLKRQVERLRTQNESKREAMRKQSETHDALQRRFTSMAEANREQCSTIDGMTEHEKHVGMIRLASTICPSHEDIINFGDEHTTEHPDGMTATESGYLHCHRGEILEILLDHIQEDHWQSCFREACLTVLKDWATDHERPESCTEREEGESGN